MRRSPIALLAGAVFLASPARGAVGADCLEASGGAATRCLVQYMAVIEQCRDRADSACETTARNDHALDAPLVAPEQVDQGACTTADAEALGYLSVADVVLRTRNACGDYGEGLLGLEYADESGAISGTLLACQRVVASSLDRLRSATVRAFGRGCYLREGRGHRCPRKPRDHRVTSARARARRTIVHRCGPRLNDLHLDPLDALLDRTVTFARHYAQQVYPPNDLGPTAEFGPFPIGVRTIALADPTRLNVQGTGPRPVTTEVYYPSTAEATAGVPRDVVSVFTIPVATTPAYRDVARAPGTYPLVVFSHGSNGIRYQSFFFAAHLASHGFVVVSPDHHGNTFVDTFSGIVDPDVARNRPLDVSFVLDRVLAFDTEPGNFFEGAIDPGRIGMSGHSFGGFTSFAIAGGATTLGTFTDARVKAILPQAPAAPFPDEFFATITVPALIVGGSIDETTPFAANQERPYERLPAGASVVGLAELTDAGHFTFSDFCEVDRNLLKALGGFKEACEPRHLPWRHAHDIVNYLSLNFFDGVLNGSADALGRLEPRIVGRIEDLTYQRK